MDCDRPQVLAFKELILRYVYVLGASWRLAYVCDAFGTDGQPCKEFLQALAEVLDLLETRHVDN